MKKRINLLNIIKNKSGASLAFVLAVMLLLMAVGISALAAAGATAGKNRQVLNQLNMYADSIQKSVMFSLQTSNDDIGRSIPETLGGQILSTIYEKAAYASPDPVESFTLNLTPELSNGTDLSGVISSVTINIDPLINFTPYTPEQNEVIDDEGNVIFTYEPRRPSTAAISGKITVTVTAEYQNESIISIVTYKLFDGLFADDGTNPDNMIISNAGIWRFISHEKADL